MQSGIFLVPYWTKIRDAGVSFLDADAQLYFYNVFLFSTYCQGHPGALGSSLFTGFAPVDYFLFSGLKEEQAGFR